VAGEEDLYADLFEPSSPLAARLRALGPFTTGEDLIARARALVSQLSEEEKVGTLNAHPKLGEDPLRLSAGSLAEQGSERRPELVQLNAEYERRFGFRFVTFVNRRSQTELAEELRQRSGRSREDEIATGVEAIIAIAESRLPGRGR
jgi:2-oxo-4-hydroxy-4-carboxy--5-ureidoimidazoline (OHCU) decarboxylase